jgi:hypothetical protein
MFKFAILHLWRNKKGSSKKFYQIDSKIFPASTLIYTYHEQTGKWVGCTLFISNIRPSTNSFSWQHKCDEIHKICADGTLKTRTIFLPPCLVPTAYFTHFQHHHMVWPNHLVYTQHAQSREKVIKYMVKKWNTMQLFMKLKKIYAGSISGIVL